MSCMAGKLFTEAVVEAEVLSGSKLTLHEFKGPQKMRNVRLKSYASKVNVLFDQ